MVLSLLMGASVSAQTKPASSTSTPVVSVIEDVTGKHFQPDTAYATLSNEDNDVLAKAPVANWGLPQESGKYITYYNLIVGTRSYQLLVAKSPKDGQSTATLLRFTNPKSKPEPIARGLLTPKENEKLK